MGSAIGAISGVTGVGKKAKRGYEAAGDQAQYKPWDVTGSYFGDADFDYANNKANYNLSPELKQLRDLFMNQALGGVDEEAIAQGDFFKKTGYDMFNQGLNTDITKEGGDYYNQLQEIMAPGRAKNEQRLANNLFASGRMGAGSAAYEGGGYVNPERLEYLTAMNREDNQMAFDAQSRARQERLNDMQTGMGYYGMGNNMRLDPYNDMYKMFAYGSDIEKMGQVPLNMGQSLGSAAQSGNQAMAQMYGMGAQARLGSDLAGAGMFTQLLGAIVEGKTLVLNLGSADFEVGSSNQYSLTFVQFCPFNGLETTSYTAYPSAFDDDAPEFPVTLVPVGDSVNEYTIASGWGPNFVTWATGNPAYDGLYQYSGTIVINDDFTIDFVGDDAWATGGSGEFSPCTQEFSYTLQQGLFTSSFTTDVVLIPN